MKYLSKRFISVLLSFTFIAIAMVIYVNLIKPVYANIKEDQAELSALRQKNHEYTEVFGKLKAILDELKKSSNLQDRISMTLPLDPNASDSMNQITAVAIANGLSVASIDIASAPIIPTAGVKAGTVSLIKSTGVLKNTVKASGSYAQIRAFLQGIESGVRLSSIKSLKISKVGVSNTLDQFSVAAEIETYYQVN
ncbi:MAG: hypothetical protein UY31_C0013G0003 [Candidatus Wolfebacteria bacterium GW2011_GWE1_48_7]|uniref:Pilus assembly protein, PilO n=2 Tax=Candidatus Wolfeibacteriota TaxID=1752735 RepID=A0A0G1U8L8_9BACT|nr:MAG: hypothetical protein UX70_C0001G0472 [Candidatus Wolfebacteria bacterium GW2011_GWB1_47_1]KKU37168.1 MAG: hypothetical protein UX49_C0001G0038 [Candidatus Wolfebacteria bacterium GW2011_GWC2_46_275]KKU42672.1 MAG: hypothetical protein UX58_C0001G0104 [Candidatus Wolfebacteria bacterium GW2011_GWB2_46_69]KKU54593.1 MAG: hypothetical protein UX76_C0001G0052 [Candidatus Wolfebacteria bacterium GW2011_GWC1_47_103]KKU59977.1 MAG: hypothetical protein UX83_C0001G0052 [Candidatus Wolfebacteria